MIRKISLLTNQLLVRDQLAVRDSYRYNADGEKTEELLNQIEGEGGVTCKYSYNADRQLIECNYIDVDKLPSAKEVYTYKDKQLVSKDTYRNEKLSARALYQYNSENQLICSLFQGVGNAIWDSKYIYDKNKKLSEEYIVIMVMRRMVF